MERLTNFSGDGFLACNGCFEPQCTNCKEFKKQASRLAEYENTGLEPAAITALQKDYKIAKDRILELPCKVGGTVYCIVQDESKFGIAIENVVDVSVRGIYINDFSDNTPNDGSLIKQEEIGKTVFLTQAEAEKALEVINDDK